MQLPEGEFYRLDYLEADPFHRRRDGVVSALLLGLVAGRALERGAAGVLLTAFPVDGLRQFYVSAGAAEGKPKGWNAPKSLLSFVFRSAALEHLKEVTDGLLVEVEKK